MWGSDDDLVKSTMLCKMCKKALLEHLLALHSGRANWMVVNECCKQLIKEKYFSISILLLNLFVVFSISSVTSSGWYLVNEFLWLQQHRCHSFCQKNLNTSNNTLLSNKLQTCYLNQIWYKLKLINKKLYFLFVRSFAKHTIFKNFEFFSIY